MLLTCNGAADLLAGGSCCSIPLCFMREDLGPCCVTNPAVHRADEYTMRAARLALHTSHQYHRGPCMRCTRCGDHSDSTLQSLSGPPRSAGHPERSALCSSCVPPSAGLSSAGCSPRPGHIPHAPKHHPTPPHARASARPQARPKRSGRLAARGTPGGGRAARPALRQACHPTLTLARASACAQARRWALRERRTRRRMRGPSGVATTALVATPTNSPCATTPGTASIASAISA